MKLNKFIEYLKEIETKEGGDTKVVMADFISVVKPVIKKDRLNTKTVIITDQSRNSPYLK